ncbi:MAG TPA: DUF1707 domain-containing protein [Yinghuangia sp.]|nr:DUF1707 domain-containing protein [Yinghuangia sp.]
MDGDGGRPTSDDRERATAVLRERMASGRLSLGEYQARLRRVKAAATNAELDAVVRDLGAGHASDDCDDERPSGTSAPSAGGSAGPAAPGRRPKAGCAGVLVMSAAVAAAAGAAYAVRSATRFRFSLPRALD